MSNEANDTGETTETVPEKSMNDLVNKAVSSHLKRHLPKMIAEALNAATVPAPSEGAEPQAQPWIREIESLKKEVAAEKKRSRDATQSASLQRATTDLTAALTSTGKLRSEAVPVVVELLKARGNLRIEDTGEISYRLGEDQFGTLEDGARAFIGSKEAALFTAPPVAANRANASTRAPNPAPLSSTSDDAKARRNELINQLPGMKPRH